MEGMGGKSQRGGKAAAKPAAKPAAKAPSAGGNKKARGQGSKSSAGDNDDELEENAPLQRPTAAQATKGGKAKAPAAKAPAADSVQLQRGEKGQLKFGGRRSVAAA